MLPKASIPSVYETPQFTRKMLGPEERRVPAVTQGSGTHHFFISPVTRPQRLELFPSKLKSLASLSGVPSPRARCQEVQVKRQREEETGLLQTVPPQCGSQAGFA